jgi:hypothetical protein
MMHAASRIYEHPDFDYSPSHEWKEWRAKISSSAQCAAVSAAALLVAASTFGIYKVSTLAATSSMVMWQDSVIHR